MPEQLGRYILDRKLAVGGMAEVFLARQSGPEGYERVCVIKRMLPHFSGDPSFVRMFLDEARLAAQLTHANIAQIYDFGAEGGIYYLAMEYVRGSNLRDVLEHHVAQGHALPLRGVAKIISDAARALDYAHGAADGAGRLLNVIHRDVSPHNILLSRGGQVKLIDFGIAKAASASSHTGTGTVKGKYAYMSPEQAQALPLDRRTDIYSLGLVLYELLSNTQALKGDSVPALMAAALNPRFPPVESLRGEVPATLARICAKALAPDRETRYATAGELSVELERYLVSEHTTMGERDLAALVPPEPLPLDDSAKPTVDVPRALEPAPDTGSYDPTFIRGTPPRTQGARRSNAAVLLGLAAGALALGVAGGVWYFRRPPPGQPLQAALPPLPAAPVDPPAPSPPVATPPPAPPPAPPAPAPLAETAPPKTSPPRPHRPPAPSPATLVVSASPAGQIWLDGRALGEAPVKSPVPPGEHTLVFRNRELGIEQSRPVHVAAGEQREERFQVGKGSVDFRALPYAEVFWGEKKLGVTPFKPVEFFEGHYKFRLANSETGKSATRDVDVAAGKKAVVSVDLRE